MRIQHTTYRKIIAVLILLGCTCQLSAQGKTYHVKADSEIRTSGNDGLSWDKAITLTEALSQAKEITRNPESNRHDASEAAFPTTP